VAAQVKAAEDTCTDLRRQLLDAEDAKARAAADARVALQRHAEEVASWRDRVAELDGQVAAITAESGMAEEAVDAQQRRAGAAEALLRVRFVFILSPCVLFQCTHFLVVVSATSLSLSLSLPQQVRMEEVAALRRACDDRALRAEEAEVQAAAEKRAREDATVRAEAAEEEVRQLAAELGRLARREVEMDHQAARDADELERLRRQVVDAAAAAAAAQDEAAAAVAAAHAEAVEARRERGAAVAQAATLTTTLAARDALVAQLESTAGERRAETDALRQRLGAAERQQQADAAAAQELRCQVETLSRRKAGHDHQVCRAFTAIPCFRRCVLSRM